MMKTSDSNENINFTIERIDGEIFKEISLAKEIAELVKPSYEDSSSLLNRELTHCNSIYLARDSAGNLMAFFMVSWEDLIVNDKKIPALYLGLSATSQKTKGTGIVRNLYSQLIQDAQQWEKINSQKMIVWYTTVTPSVFHAINLLFDNNEPLIDGSYKPENEKYVLAIRNKMRWGLHDHPFVLKNVAKGTHYSAIEKQRINKIITEKNFQLFSELGIEENNGDRLLRICSIPDIDSY